MESESHERSTPFGHERAATPENGSWPVRARRLMGELHALVRQYLEPALRQAVTDAEQQFYAHADRARNHVDQQRYFESRHALQRERTTVQERFSTLLGERFHRTGDTASHDEASAPLALSLLDRNEHEQSAALEKLIARGESRNSAALFELGYRMAALVAAPPLEGEDLPLGPHALVQAFHGATATLELPIEHRLALLQAFDHAVIQGLGALYDTANDLLRGDGILVHLRAYPMPRQVSRQAAVSPPTDHATPTQAHAPPVTAQGDHIAVLENLRQLLAQQRAGYEAHASGAGTRAATGDELQQALDALQGHVSDITDHASRELRSAQRLREELLAQLNANKPAGVPRTHLSPEQGDTVELMAMLFEQMHRQMRQGSHAQGMLSHLQVPMLRMAIADREFFEQREHPARRLLGAVAEAANEWMDTGDTEADRAVAAKLDQLVARTQREAPSTGLYTSLLADIEHHLAQLARKAQIAERRHVEAMQGRERLEQARRRATQLMAERFRASPPRGLLRTLLERAWTDVLALTLLRHGEDSEAFTDRLRITDQLLGRLPADDRSQLQADVENGLQQIGMHADEAEQVAQRLLGTLPDNQAAEQGPSATELALRLKQHQRLGEQTGVPPTAEPSMQPAQAFVEPVTPAINLPAMPSSTPPAQLPSRVSVASKPEPSATPRIAAVDAREQRIYERLRQLPFGSWFEFVDTVSGKVSPRKLAWFSPISGHCLFVTRRGQRVDDMTLQALARAMAQGQVRELAQVHENLLERAWHALTRSLRRASAQEEP
ncbi:DUF1631 family protein [Dyella sp.]|uniref:DUF1631 family protein n=1 Tax=Dyella sp. TaxID=1869338 RepID=UPI002ED3B922